MMLKKRFMIGLVLALLLLSFASGVWAQPGKSALRLTVPTRTPKPVVVEPTEAPAEPTAAPEPTAKPTKKPEKQWVNPDPTQAPTEAVAAPVEATPTTAAAAPTADVAAQATSAAMTEAGYPESGADLLSLIVPLSALSVVAVIAGFAIARRRLRARG